MQAAGSRHSSHCARTCTCTAGAAARRAGAPPPRAASRRRRRGPPRRRQGPCPCRPPCRPPCRRPCPAAGPWALALPTSERRWPAPAAAAPSPSAAAASRVPVAEGEQGLEDVCGGWGGGREGVHAGSGTHTRGGGSASTPALDGAQTDRRVATKPSSCANTSLNTSFNRSDAGPGPHLLGEGLNERQRAQAEIEQRGRSLRPALSRAAARSQAASGVTRIQSVRASARGSSQSGRQHEDPVSQGVSTRSLSPPVSQGVSTRSLSPPGRAGPPSRAGRRTRTGASGAPPGRQARTSSRTTHPHTRTRARPNAYTCTGPARPPAEVRGQLVVHSEHGLVVKALVVAAASLAAARPIVAARLCAALAALLRLLRT
jgi:hypothetical protein